MRQLELSVRDSQAFVDMLLNSKPVNDRRRDTVRRDRETTRDQPVPDAPEGSLQVEALGPQHDHSSFVSGAEAPDRSMQSQAQPHKR